MKPSDLLPKLEGNYLKTCTIFFKNGQVIYKRVFHGTNVNDYGDMYLIVSDGKSQTKIDFFNIQSIEFDI